MTVAEIRSMIDQLAALKGDRLHLHLSDSQSWRLEIKGYPALDGTGCNGSACIAGFYTQEDFKGLVKYAADRFIEIVPELEGPAHATAAVRSLGGVAVMGCQGQTQTDRFCTNPNDPASERALAFWRDAIAQLAAISPAPIIHIGGDEAIGMPHEDYKWWIGQMETIVNDSRQANDGLEPRTGGIRTGLDLHQPLLVRLHRRWPPAHQAGVVQPGPQRHHDPGMERLSRLRVRRVSRPDTADRTRQGVLVGPGVGVREVPVRLGATGVRRTEGGGHHRHRGAHLGRADAWAGHERVHGLPAAGRHPGEGLVSQGAHPGLRRVPPTAQRRRTSVGVRRT